MLLSREYSSKVIQAAIDRARQIPRLKALEKVIKQKTTDRPVFVIHYDPRLPSVNAIVKKHWRVMTQEQKFSQNLKDLRDNYLV